MLPKRNRVNKNTFNTIWSKGSVAFGSFFVFHYLKEKEPRFSFVAPKKIAKTAVKRNLLRRNGYRILKSLNLMNGQGIFLYKKEALNKPNNLIEKDIKFLLKKAGFIEENTK